MYKEAPANSGDELSKDELPDPEPDASTGEAGSSTGAPDGTSTGEPDSAGFLAPIDVAQDLRECDTFAQDCPAGEKCIFQWDPNYSDFYPRCVNLHPQPQPVGGPCQIFGDTDDCGLGAMCWDPDPVTGIGMCVELCGGSPDSPKCDTPDTFCAGKSIQICLQICDPRVTDTCPVGCGCYATSGVEFMCAIDASGELGAYGDPCEYANACDPGLQCVNPALVPDCPGAGCCTTPCDITAPACPDPALECVPWYPEGTAPDALATLGICILPE